MHFEPHQSTSQTAVETPLAISKKLVTFAAAAVDAGELPYFHQLG